MRSHGQHAFAGLLRTAKTVAWNGPPLVYEAHQDDMMSFISTGCGSILKFLEGQEPPAFTALKECGA